MGLHYISATEALKKFKDKTLSPVELIKAIIERAEKINPKDYIVLGNIALGYKLKGDKEKAIEYYEKTVEYGDESAKEYAKQQLKELKE